MPDPTNITSGEVIPIQGRMTPAQYEQERARLREVYGDERKNVGAKWDQAFASLFYRSGWTQQELADKEGKSQRWVSYQLTFGRFLHFSTTVLKLDLLPSNFAERSFREFWERTDKTLDKDELRFRQVAKMLKEDAIVSAPRRPGIGKELRNRFADGKWHPLKRMANSLETDDDHVETTLEAIRKNQTYECTAERKTVGTEVHWRIFKLDKAISSNEIAEKLDPILKKLELEGRKNMATMSPTTVAILASQLRKLFEEWTE